MITAWIDEHGNRCGPVDRVNAVPVHLKKEEPVRTMPQLHAEIARSKTKQDLLKACVEWISAQGGWSDCPEEVWYKAHAAAGLVDKPRKPDPVLQEYRALNAQGPANQAIPGEI